MPNELLRQRMHPGDVGHRRLKPAHAWLVAGLIAILPLAVVHAQGAELPGDYERVSVRANSLEMAPPPLRMHGQDVATLDVYQSFICPHCQKFYPVLDALRARYGNRLVIREHYIALSERMLNPDMRLYLVAQRVGLGDAAAGLLMRARLNPRDPDGMLRTVTDIAGQLSLQNEFAQALRDPAAAQEIAEHDRRAGFIVETPTVILDRQLALGVDPQNIVTVIDGALKPVAE